MAQLPTGYTHEMQCGAPGSSATTTTDVSTCKAVECSDGYGGVVAYLVGQMPGGAVEVEGCKAAVCEEPAEMAGRLVMGCTGVRFGDATPGMRCTASCDDGFYVAAWG